MPWEVNKSTLFAYLAGFLDGDGSIVAKIEKKEKFIRNPYKIKLRLAFTQCKRNERVLKRLKQFLKVGYVRNNPHHHRLSEFVISDRRKIKEILQKIVGMLVVKKRQARLALEIISICEKYKKGKCFTEKDFQRIFRLALQIRKLNAKTGLKR